MPLPLGFIVMWELGNEEQGGIPLPPLGQAEVSDHKLTPVNISNRWVAELSSHGAWTFIDHASASSWEAMLTGWAH